MLIETRGNGVAAGDPQNSISFGRYRLSQGTKEAGGFLLEESKMPTIDMTATGEKIKKTREMAGMTVKDVQEVFGFASPYPVYKWQNGQSLPAIENLVVLAALFGVTMDELVVTKKL